MKNFSISILIITIVSFFVFPTFVLADWVGPSDNPPNSNEAKPVNVSADPQVKTGILWVGGTGSNVAGAAVNVQGDNLGNTLLMHLITANQANMEGLKIDCDGEASDIPFRIRTDTSGGAAVNDADTKFIVKGDGYVGIGTSSPSSALHIDMGASTVLDVNTGVISEVGNPLGDNDAMPRLYADGRYAPLSAALPTGTSGQTLRHNGTSWIANSVLYNNGSNVGIGTTNPVSIGDGSNPTILSIHKQGATTLGGLLQLTTNQTAINTTVGAVTFGSTGLSNADKRLAEISGLKTNASTVSGTGDMVFSNWNGGVYGESMRIKANGNVGIGIDAPSAKLEVEGTFKSYGLGVIYRNTELRINQVARDVRFTWPTQLAGRDGSFGTYLLTWSNRAQTTSYILNVKKQWSGSFIVTMTKVGGNGDAGFDTIVNNTTDLELLFKQNISSATHQSSHASFSVTVLEESSTARRPTIVAENRAGGWTYPSLPVNYLGSGNVGIGTSDPKTRLHVSGSQASFTNGQGQDEGIFLIPENSFDQNAGGRIFFKENSNNGYGFSVGYNGAGPNAILNWPSDYFIIARHNNNTTGAVVLSIERATGEVGIGTADPDAELHVEGDAKITGELELGGADVAEEFITDRIYPAGTVLIMGDSGYKSARASNKEYDTSVIGVVSDNASLIMGKVKSDKKAVVALVGVVKVKVNNSGGVIGKGDLLTTSSIYGEAMLASEPKIGTVIGKALENLYGERGEVMALVNLQ